MHAANALSKITFADLYVSGTLSHKIYAPKECRMKKKNGRKLLGVLLVLTMVLGLLHGMSLTVYSDTEKSETENEKTLEDAKAVKCNNGTFIGKETDELID